VAVAGFDPRTVGQLLGSQRAAFHQQLQHADARGIADDLGEALDVGGILLRLCHGPTLGKQPIRNKRS
jgi:hypothetical protein